ncbi:MAG: pre-rRNA-processing protein esf1 [Pleopsidium flavum]|nr:MAG: pre-rRNA-processing protein esf1 [Pleopsidium flavum]
MSKAVKQKAPKGSRNSRDVADTTIMDPRFSNIHTDPRFRLPSKKHTHVQLDKRFSHMLRDDEFSKKAAVDRYGRKLPSNTGRKELERFYRVEEEAEEIDDVDDDEEVAKELRRIGKNYDPARDGGFSSSSDDSSSDEGDAGEVEEAEETEVLGFPDQQPGQETGIPMGEISSRIAVVNLDWDNIRAADLMAVFSSFVPMSGRILKASVYPSEFGGERMEREEMEGPPKEIFAAAEGKEGDGSSESEEAGEDEDEDEKIKKSIVQEDKGEEFDSAKLRRYQLERLRYYYAVLTCSSPAVAKHIYDAVDGTEYLTTANFFDLRFIPDDIDFSNDKPRDECERMPDGYRPNDFVTDALQHSKVRLTWDADDGARKEVQRRAFAGSRAEIDENDLKAYLGSDSSDDEGPGPVVIDASTMITTSGNGNGIGSENEKATPKATKKERERQRMRSLLGLGAASAPGKKSKATTGGPVGDMQITFCSGLSSAPAKSSVFENEPESVETTVEKYVRKEKERKARRKEKMKGARNGDPTTSAGANGSPDVEGEDDAPNGELGFEDPFFTAPADDKVANTALRKAERRKKREQRAADEVASSAKRAELELLMVDDKASDVKHFDMNEIQKAEKAARKRNRRKRAAAEENGEKEQSGFQMDVQDPRFSSLFESHEFAIDPTNPRFKGTAGMKALLEEGRRKRQRGGEEVDGGADEKLKRKRRRARASDTGDGAGDGDDLQRLVERVKGKI